MLRYTQQAIALHHAHLAFVYGDYKDLDPDHEQVYACPTLSEPDQPDQRDRQARKVQRDRQAHKVRQDHKAYQVHSIR